MRAIYKILFVLLLCTPFIACDKNDGEGIPQGDALLLKASNDTIILEEEKAEDVVLTFTWNKGIDQGAENTITYIFRLDIFGADFKTSTTPLEFQADGNFTVSYTHKELNDLITKKWGILPGNDVKLQARVVAKVDGPKFIYPEISIVEIETKSYVIAPKPLFLMGDATMAGMDPAKSIKLTEAEIGGILSLERESESW